MSPRDVIDASSLKRSSADHCSHLVGLKGVDEDALREVREALLGGAEAVWEHLAPSMNTRQGEHEHMSFGARPSCQDEHMNTRPLVRS